MGAHVWAPAYLRDHLLPHFRLSGWSPDWYAGFPAYQFYMVIPALAVVILDVVLPYGLALKLVSIAGVLTLPVAAWAFGKLSGLRFPAPPMFAAIAVVFLFDETFTIYGGNIASTMAGEFSFSIALSLSLVYFGVLARGLRTGRHRALRGGVARAVRPVAPHRRDLRRGRHDRVVPPLPGSSPLQVARDHTSGRGVAHRVLGRAVLDAASLPHRHGVRATHRLREPALPGHVEVGRHPRRARRDRLARRDRAPTADRHLARADDAHLRRLDHRVAAEHVLERAADALLLPVQVPPRRPRCGGDRALAGVDRVAPVRSGREAGSDRAHPGRRCARLCDRARHEPAHPARRAHGDGAEVVRAGLRVQLVGPHQHEIGVRRRLGEVELPRLRGQARVRRVPRRDDDHGRDRPDARLRAGGVGVRLRAQPVRHADVDDAPPVLDRRLHRVDGGPLLRVVRNDAVPLPREFGAVGRTFASRAQPDATTRSTCPRASSTCSSSECGTTWPSRPRP